MHTDIADTPARGPCLKVVIDGQDHIPTPSSHSWVIYTHHTRSTQTPHHRANHLAHHSGFTPTCRGTSHRGHHKHPTTLSPTPDYRTRLQVMGDEPYTNAGHRQVIGDEPYT